MTRIDSFTLKGLINREIELTPDFARDVLNDLIERNYERGKLIAEVAEARERESLSYARAGQWGYENDKLRDRIAELERKLGRYQTAVEEAIEHGTAYAEYWRDIDT